MKHFYILLAILCSMITACSTMQSITINGTPGTEIYSPDKKKLATINQSGQANVNISSDDYYAFLLSRQQDSEQYVPFALDYNFKSSAQTEALTYTGMTLAFAGCACMLPATILLAAGVEDVGAILYLAGTGATGLGMGLGMPMDMRLQQTQYQYQYKYISPNSTNQDIKFEEIVDNGYQKNSIGTEKSSKAKSSSSSKSSTSSKSTSKQTKSSSSSRTLKDYAKIVSGTYVGDGVLRKGNEIIEQYDEIKIVIKRTNSTSVEVDVIENGVSYFDQKATYSIKKGAKGYEMTIKDIPNARMNINSDKTISYIHPSVEIDGDIYKLEITAKKE